MTKENAHFSPLFLHFSFTLQTRTQQNAVRRSANTWAQRAEAPGAAHLQGGSPPLCVVADACRQPQPLATHHLPRGRSYSNVPQRFWIHKRHHFKLPKSVNNQAPCSSFCLSSELMISMITIAKDSKWHGAWGLQKAIYQMPFWVSQLVP